MVAWVQRLGSVCSAVKQGSASTGVACVNTGRNFVGIEIDEKYYSVARQRIDEAINRIEQDQLQMTMDGGQDDV